MIAWTTPTIPILVKGIETTNEYSVYFTISQGCSEVTVEPFDSAQADDGIIFYIGLTQEQTGAFTAGKAKVQANIIDASGYRAASNKQTVTIGSNLIDEVLQDA